MITEIIKLELKGEILPDSKVWSDSAISQLQEQYGDRKMIQSPYSIDIHFIGNHQFLDYVSGSMIHFAFERILAFSFIALFGYMSQPSIKYFYSSGNPTTEVYIHV